VLKRKQRPGFTLAEVLVAFGLIAVLASVTVPVIKARVQDGYEDALIQEMQSVASGVIAYRQDVGFYPPAINYLESPVPTTGLFPGKNLCNQTLAQSDSAKWNGPYISRSFPTNAASYVVAGRDAVQNSFASGTGNIQIQIFGVDTTTAHNIDFKIDGQFDNTTGTLRYTISGASANLQYLIPTRTGAC